jgi:hypothetical protein
MSWLWLFAPAAVFVVWITGHLRRDRNDLGSVSAQWLHDYRRETHQDR